VQQHPGELVRKDFRIGLAGEVAVLQPGAGVAADHPVQQLTQAVLPGLRPGRAPEVLAGDDVDRVERPALRELHTALLEVDGAVAPVRHHDVAPGPAHLVIGVHALGGVDALHPDAQLACGITGAACAGSDGLGSDGFGHGVPLSDWFVRMWGCWRWIRRRSGFGLDAHAARGFPSRSPRPN